MIARSLFSRQMIFFFAHAQCENARSRKRSLLAALADALGEDKIARFARGENLLLAPLGEDMNARCSRGENILLAPLWEDMNARCSRGESTLLAPLGEDRRQDCSLRSRKTRLLAALAEDTIARSACGKDEMLASLAARRSPTHPRQTANLQNNLTCRLYAPRFRQ